MSLELLTGIPMASSFSDDMVSDHHNMIDVGSL